MELDCLDHIHFVVPDLARAKQLYGPFLRGDFVEDYGGPEMNAWGGWNTSGGDFIQPIDPEKPVFGGAPMPHQGITSVSFRVAEIDRGIEQARRHGLVVRSRVGSEDIGLGKNVVQAQLEPEPVSKLPFELVEHQLPGEYVPLTEAAVHHVECGVEDLDASVDALTGILGDGFGPEWYDTSRGLRWRCHDRLGLRLSTRLDPAGGGEDVAWRCGITTVAFHVADRATAISTAVEIGLTVSRTVETRAGHEVDFAPWAGTTLRLVEPAQAERG
jgi:catechol 2,3-dioxygenase-like lactoylglutathione lyase family enzyme